MIINTIKVNLKLEFQFWHPNNRPFEILVLYNSGIRCGKWRPGCVALSADHAQPDSICYAHTTLLYAAKISNDLNLKYNFEH